jgi:hypothetical protein
MLDGFWLEYEFAARDGLPAKIIYMRRDRAYASPGNLGQTLDDMKIEGGKAHSKCETATSASSTGIESPSIVK